MILQSNLCYSIKKDKSSKKFENLYIQTTNGTVPIHITHTHVYNNHSKKKKRKKLKNIKKQAKNMKNCLTL